MKEYREELGLDRVEGGGQGVDGKERRETARRAEGAMEKGWGDHFMFHLVLSLGFFLTIISLKSYSFMSFLPLKMHVYVT